VSKPYLVGFSGQLSKEFVERAKNQGHLEVMREELLEFKESLDDIQRSSSSPVQDKEDLVYSVQDEYSEMTVDVINTLWSNADYIKKASFVLDDIEHLCRFEMGEVEATVVVAEAMTQEQYDKVYAKAKSLCDDSVKQLYLKEEVQPKILGGLKFRVEGRGGYEWDYSAIGKIMACDQAMRAPEEVDM
jgi:F0F1-type ATP synthase delta subunit